MLIAREYRPIAPTYERSDQSLFTARCARVGSAAAALGATLAKSDEFGPALDIGCGGNTVTFPIVTDPDTWKDTTVDEALYAVLVDARGWSAATFDEVTIAALDAAEQAELPTIKRDLSLELGRLEQLADVLGGDDKLETLYSAAGL